MVNDSIHDIWNGDIIPESGVDVAVGRNSLDFPSPVVPLLDVHLRRAEFHDSGENSNSGIVSFHAEKNRLELIPSNSGAQPIVTAVLFDAYDNTGGSTISSTATTLNIDTERVNTHPEVYALESDVLTINMSGVYEFEYRASFDNSTGTRSSVRTFMERRGRGSSTFAEIPGTRSFSYHRTAAAGEDSSNTKFILEAIAPGESYRVRSQILSGAASLAQVVDATSLTVKKLA